MKDLRKRLSKARSSYTRLKRIRNSKKMTRRAKIKLYKTLVLPVLLYRCETWKINKEDEKMPDVFKQKCLRKILTIRWQDCEEVRKRAGMEPLSCDVEKRRWKMIYHVLRQDREIDCNIALTWAPERKKKREDQR